MRRRVVGFATMSLVACLLAIAFAACVMPATEVLTILDTDIPDTRFMTIATRISRVGSDGGATQSWVRQRGAIGSITLPLSFGIVPASDQLRDSAVALDVEVHVSPGASGEPALNFRRSAHFHFVPHQPLSLRIFLTASCGALTNGCTHPGADGCTLSQLCDEQGLTCGDEGRCVAIDAPVMTLDASALPHVDASDTQIASDAHDGPDSACPTCPTRPHATTTCIDETCAFSCDTGYADCDTNPQNGCEAALQTDAMQCGTCGHACATAPNAAAQCTAGACGITCATGFADCDGMTANGCEALVGQDTANCGSCHHACPTGLANATESCNAGACMMQCNPGFADCDANPMNGCEASLTDALHCGSCTTVCSGTTPMCGMGSTGTVTCVSGCGASTTRCGSSCVDLTSDAGHCGSCTTVCSGGQTCQASACRCPTGQTLCSGTCRNTSTDAANCGACGTSCGAASCSAGHCVCGAVGQPCCSGTTCNAGAICSGGRCAACGGAGQPCCAGSACGAGTVCRSGSCMACGHGGQFCCSGNTCTEGNCTAAFGDYYCVCGGRGQACCAGNACNEGACQNVFGSNICVCGGSGQLCCAGGGCDSPMCCTGFGTCGCCGLDQPCTNSPDCCGYPSVFCCRGPDSVLRCTNPGTYPGC